MNNINMTPSRASFAGFASRVNHSPSFRDIARRIMVPTEKVKGSKEVRQALVNAIAVLIVVFILITLYAVNVIIVPHLRILLLALLFGSFLHPMKRSLAKFFKQILKEIRDHDNPIFASIFIPFSIVDRAVERVRLNFCNYLFGIASFARSIFNGDIESAVGVCLAAISLAIIGTQSLINLVMCINLITFFREITRTNVSFSDAYLHFLVRSFLLAQFCWLHPYVIALILLAISLWVAVSWTVSKVKQKLITTTVTAKANKDSTQIFDETLESDLDDSVDEAAKLPHARNISKAYKTLVHAQKFIVQQLEESVDTISSACVIGIVAFIVIVTALYLSFQIYVESIYLIEKASSSANAIQSNNPELKSWLPDWLNVVHFLLDVAVKNIYQHGREWIRKSTRQLLNNAAIDSSSSNGNVGLDSSSMNATENSTVQLEKQMIDFWDKAYELWQRNRANGSSSADAAANLRGHPAKGVFDWDSLLVSLQSMNFSLFAQMFKQNLDTLLAVTGSLTKLLKDNLNLAVNLVTVIFSLLLLWANVLVNFILDLIIFTTALFYLLCASDDEYKPIEMLKSLLPRARAAQAGAAPSSSVLVGPQGVAMASSSMATAATSFVTHRAARRDSAGVRRDEFLNMVDESINAVFTASLKMMAFHGLSTWLLHMLFELEVVYVPSVVAAIFAVVPFISPYWASLPACLDLWLSGQVSRAVLMLLLATIPSSFVTSAFYSEIKGAGHPYLTGLAIAAGIFVFGIEGALFGPMLLVSIRLLPIIIIYFLDLFS